MISKNVDFYAHTKEEKCVFKIMHSRQSATTIEAFLNLLKGTNKGYKLYILSLEEKVPQTYTNLGVEVILISKLLHVDVNKLIII